MYRRLFLFVIEEIIGTKEELKNSQFDFGEVKPLSKQIDDVYLHQVRRDFYVKFLLSVKKMINVFIIMASFSWL